MDPDILCNKCGDSLDKAVGTQRDSFHRCFEGLENAIVVAGYDANHLVDGNSYKFSLCEKCLVTLFESFKTPPEVRDDLHSTGDTSWAEDRESWERTATSQHLSDVRSVALDVIKDSGAAMAVTDIVVEMERLGIRVTEAWSVVRKLMTEVDQFFLKKVNGKLVAYSDAEERAFYMEDEKEYELAKYLAQQP